MITIRNWGYALMCLGVLLASCKSTYHAVPSVGLLDISSSIEDKPTRYDSIIAPYKKEVDQTMGEVIAVAPVALKKGRPSGTLNRWFAATLLAVADSLYDGSVDVALQNYGGLRVPEVPAGNITVRTLYEVMPFENMIVILDVTGQQLQQIVDRVARDGGWPAAGLSMKIKDRRATEVLIQGRPIDPARRYAVALPDYVANGGNGSDYLVDWPRVNTGALIRDAMIDHLRNAYAAGHTEIHLPTQPNITQE